MILRRYFPGFCDVEDSARWEVSVSSGDEALAEAVKMLPKCEEGETLIREKDYISRRYPDGKKYVVALILNDDKKSYANLD